MSRILTDARSFARVTMMLAASCAIELLVRSTQRLLAPADAAASVGAGRFLFWLGTGAVVAGCGIRGGRHLLHTGDSRGDIRLVIYAIAACVEYGERASPMRYMWTPGLSLNMGIGYDSAWLGVNVIGAALFAWLLALRGHELTVANQTADEAAATNASPKA